MKLSVLNLLAASFLLLSVAVSGSGSFNKRKVKQVVKFSDNENAKEFSIDSDFDESVCFSHKMTSFKVGGKTVQAFEFNESQVSSLNASNNPEYFIHMFRQRIEENFGITFVRVLFSEPVTKRIKSAFTSEKIRIFYRKPAEVTNAQEKAVEPTEKDSVSDSKLFSDYEMIEMFPDYEIVDVEKIPVNLDNCVV